MRAKTTPQTRKHTKTSSSEQSGLIAKERSAVAKRVLDDRSHRTRTRRRRGSAAVPSMRLNRLRHLLRMVPNVDLLKPRVVHKRDRTEGEGLQALYRGPPTACL